MIDLWLVRHGQTDWNLERRVQGWTDVPLNRTGIRQAQALANALHGIPFQVIYASDLSRARVTASILQSALGAPLYVDSRLRERCFGSAEGTIRQVTPRVASFSPKLSLASTNPVKWSETGEHAETDYDVYARAMQFLHVLSDRHGQGRILCVSHGGLIRVLLTCLGAQQEISLQNTSVSRLGWNGQEWRVATVNWANHLRNAEH